MKDRDPSEDITQQRYKGPSSIVAGLGEGLLHGKALLISGILTGALVGAIFPTRAAILIDNAQSHLSELRASDNHFKKGAGQFAHWLLGTGEGVIKWVKGIPTVERKLSEWGKNEKTGLRIATGINGAVVASALLSAFGIFTGFFSGTRSSHRGQHQFTQAKEEIISLRADNAKLRDKLLSSQFAFEDFKTADAALHGTLKVAKDDTPHVEPTSVPSSHIQLTDAQHIAPGLGSDVALG